MKWGWKVFDQLRSRSADEAARTETLHRPLCPRCGADEANALGHVSSALLWFNCPRCNHVWFVRPVAARRDEGT